MKRIFLIIITAVCLANDCKTQPLLDIIKIHYQASPDAGAFRQNLVHNNTRCLNAELNLPVKFKNKKSILLVSPAFEETKFNFPRKDTRDVLVKGWTLPLLWIQTINTRWTVTVGTIVRNNAEQFDLKKAWQVGGIALATFEQSKQLKYKLGLYYNSELFGPFFVPLLGIDWRTDKTNIYGVLPGNFTIERKLSAVFYCGATFRSITHSYQLVDNKFIRISDNQLGLFVDYYLAKHIVLNVEAGHTFFRRIRLGDNYNHPDYYFTAKTNDNWLLNGGLAYRFRL